MAQKKRSGTKKNAVSKKKAKAKKVARKAKVTASRKTRSPKRKPAPKVKRTAKKKGSTASAADEIRSPEQSSLSRTFRRGPGKRPREIGSGSAGQSGDLQGLSRRVNVDSESVEELVEEGQFFEAGIVAGVEGALDADQG